MVYLLGAGVFTVSLFRVVHGTPQVIRQEGIKELGGNNFDALIVGFILNKLGFNPARLQSDINSLLKLKYVAEQIKIGLSKDTTIELDDNVMDFASMRSIGNFGNIV